MPDQSHHCPFLNRADRRCADHFSLDHLDHAFEFCFDAYGDCPVYQELLLERQIKRVSAMVIPPESTAGMAAAGMSTARMKIGADHAKRKLVQIALPRRYAQSAA
jgi:hypothetical protein